MKKYSILLIVAFITGCGEQAHNAKIVQSNSSNIYVLSLVDSLGTLNLEIPSQYDTLITWVDHSDCGKPCDRQMYRYQQKSMPIQKESGFFYPVLLIDSVDQITISHNSWFRLQKSDSGISLARHKSLEYHSKIQSQNMDLYRDTFFVVNGRGVSVYARERSDSTYGREVLATTSAKGVEIEFEFKFMSRKQAPDEKRFFRDAIDILRTIKIDNKPNTRNR